MKNRKVLATFILLLGFARHIAAQGTGPASIEGMVTQAGAGDGLPSALVAVANSSGGERRVTAGADGKFVMRNLPPGAYKITVTKSGYFPPPESAGPISITLGAGQNLTGLNLRLLKGGVIAGRLTDERRSPRSNLRIDVLRYRFLNGQRTLSMVGTAATDDRGEFRISGLEGGEYFIRSAVPFDRGEQATAPIPPTFYPGVADAPAAVGIPVKLGMEAGGINFSLGSSDRTYAVKVRVVIPPGNTDRLVSVYLDARNSADLPVGTASQLSPNDSFRFERTRPGAYILSARMALDNLIWGRALYGSAAVVVSDEDVDAGTITLEPGVDLTGRLVPTGPLPTTVDMQRVRLALTVVEGAVRVTPQQVVPEPDGTFRMTSLPKAAYRLTVTGLPDTVFVEAVRFDTRIAADLVFTVDGQPPGALEVRIGGPAGVVQGVVRNATNGTVAGARVALIPSVQRRGNLDLFHSTTTDQNGVFTIRGVVPDDYLALAWEKVEAGAYQNAEFVKQYENGAAKVSVGRGSVNDLNLRAIP